jgi:hypothetical protein
MVAAFQLLVASMCPVARGPVGGVPRVSVFCLSMEVRGDGDAYYVVLPAASFSRPCIPFIGFSIARCGAM